MESEHICNCSGEFLGFLSGSVTSKRVRCIVIRYYKKQDLLKFKCFIRLFSPPVNMIKFNKRRGTGKSLTRGCLGHGNNLAALTMDFSQRYV